MPRFHEDNTEGYSVGDLAELNRRFDRAVADEISLASLTTDELAYKSWLDRVAEDVKATFDAQCSAVDADLGHRCRVT